MNEGLKENMATDNLRTNPYEMEPDDVAFIKAIWKSAHAVQEWPGKITIRRYSPFNKFAVIGEGKNIPEAWRDAVKRVEKVTRTKPEEADRG